MGEGKKESPWFFTFAAFCGRNTNTMIHFKVWGHRMRGWEKICTISQCQPGQVGFTMPPEGSALQNLTVSLLESEGGVEWKMKDGSRHFCQYEGTWLLHVSIAMCSRPLLFRQKFLGDSWWIKKLEEGSDSKWIIPVSQYPPLPHWQSDQTHTIKLKAE